MGGALGETLGRDPIVAVVEHGDGVPFAMKEYMQHVKNVCAICLDKAYSRLVTCLNCRSRYCAVMYRRRSYARSQVATRLSRHTKRLAIETGVCRECI